MPCLVSWRKVCPVGRLYYKHRAGKCFWPFYLIFLPLKLSPSSHLMGHFSDDKAAFYKATFIWLCIVLCFSVRVDRWKCIEKDEEGPTYFIGVLSFGKVKWPQNCFSVQHTTAVYQEEPVKAKRTLLQLPFGELTHLCLCSCTGWVETVLIVFLLIWRLCLCFLDGLTKWKKITLSVPTTVQLQSKK